MAIIAHPIRENKTGVTGITPYIGVGKTGTLASPPDKTNGISLTWDYTPEYLMFGLLLTAGSGNLDLIFEDGSEAIFPYTVDSGCSEILESLRIVTVKSSSTTTFNGKIFPLF
jgi:hypothetical protein